MQEGARTYGVNPCPFTSYAKTSLWRRRPDSNRRIMDLQSIALGRLATPPEGRERVGEWKGESQAGGARKSQGLTSLTLLPASIQSPSHPTIQLVLRNDLEVKYREALRLYTSKEYLRAKAIIEQLMRDPVAKIYPPLIELERRVALETG